MQKILIVEDDNILAKAFSIALTEDGYDIQVATDGEEAIKKIKQIKPDLVLLDLIIPQKSGEEVLAEIKKDSELKDIPVLVLTVKSDSASISRCVALGVRGYFIKAHYSLEDISKEVKKVLNGK
ncbi:MAG: response regulator [Candidatus Magasanikbacteria bacterium]|jgi:CheY-like chemotaxis protein